MRKIRSSWERLSAGDTWFFSIYEFLWVFAGNILQLGSGFYLIMKYVGDVWLNWLLGWYFAIAGVDSVWNVSL